VADVTDLYDVKRALWCRWVHRWNPNRYTFGWSRTTCRACRDAAWKRKAWLTLPEAAEVLRRAGYPRKEATLRWWIHRGYLTARRIPGDRRVFVHHDALMAAEGQVNGRSRRQVSLTSGG
jgi:hypothetical protein